MRFIAICSTALGVIGRATATALPANATNAVKSSFTAPFYGTADNQVFCENIQSKHLEVPMDLLLFIVTDGFLIKWPILAATMRDVPTAKVWSTWYAVSVATGTSAIGATLLRRFSRTEHVISESVARTVAMVTSGESIFE